MRASGRLISIALMLLASPAPAQVINGESTYGDSDLHQPPTETLPTERAREEQRKQLQAPPERR